MEATTADIAVRIGLGLVLSTLIGSLAQRRGSLSRSGVAGAVLTGTLIFGFAGWIAGFLLIAFFASSSRLSKFKAQARSKCDAARLFDKGGRRDIWQALANGGVAAACAVAAGVLTPSPETLFPGADAGTALYAAMLGALASANADTWATELGVLSRSQPRLITTLRPVERGTSGGVSGAGGAAALAGAAFIALIAVLAHAARASIMGQAIHASLWAICAIVTAAGVLGSLADSLLGATLQAMYLDRETQQPTEKAIGPGGAPDALLRGVPWLNNDWVNFLATLTGACLALAATSIIL